MFIQQLSVALGIISLIGLIASSGKQKKISAFLLGISVLSGIVTFSSLDHHSLSSPKQSVGQEQQPVQEMTPIVIDHDGGYDLPDRPLKICFTKSGDPTKDFYVDQQIKIDDWTSGLQRLSGCLDIPTYLNGKTVNISLNAMRQYTPEIKRKWGFGDDINNDYEYYMRIGVGGYPVIQSR